MFVVVDIEWAVNSAKKQSLTQIAAAKIDEQCRAISWFFSYVKPRNSSFHDWNNVCYRGATPKDFLTAPNAAAVLQDFENWLGEEATLLFWHNTSCAVYKKIRTTPFMQECKRKCISISNYVIETFRGRWTELINPYLLAREHGIPISEIEHVSIDDVKVVLKLLREAKIEPSQLEDATQRFSWSSGICTPYQYDVEEQLLHKAGCSHMVSGHELKGFLRIEDCIKGNLKPCKYCMAEELLQARIKKNLDTINRSKYNYVHIKDSKIFHKRTCGLFCRTGKELLGTTFYQSVIKKGKTPCKVCNPSLFDTPTVFHAQALQKKEKPIKAKAEKKQPRRSSSKVMRAINRHKEIKQERDKLLRVDNLTAQEKQDIYTLTQPEYSFWAITGCATFHLRSCPKLLNMNHYKGFKQYNQAVKSGYRPCKTCKPTAKYDTLLSIPFESKPRENESVEELIKWCEQKRYPYVDGGECFSLNTPVGEWRLYLQRLPIQVEHNNLITGGGFHQQPRIFLSFYDAFSYIHRHDKSLMHDMGFSKEASDNE